MRIRMKNIAIRRRIEVEERMEIEDIIEIIVVSIVILSYSYQFTEQLTETTQFNTVATLLE